MVDPSIHQGADQVFFGATVRYEESSSLSAFVQQRTVTIMGIDEADNQQGQVSWVSPIARALLRAHVGDEVNMVTPSGVYAIVVLSVAYPCKTAT